MSRYDDDRIHPDNNEHAGNGTVNHGPDGQGSDGPEDRSDADGRLDGDGGSKGNGSGSGGGLLGLDRFDGDDSADGFGPDELALRRLMHQVVQEVEPTDGTLEHLRRAVPARRARKRQAFVGMAAAALFIGTAVPALIHVSNSTGSDPNPSMAGSTADAQGGSSQGKGPDGGSGGSASNGSSKGKGKDGQKGKGDKGKGAGTGGTGGAVSASPASAPACTAVQLASAGGDGTPDSTGAVYGTFRISNVSQAICTISASGSVNASAVGAADQTKLTVVNHVAGDAASGLPDPATEVGQLALRPGEAYEVKFAWVPSGTCPTSGGTSGGPTDGPTPSEGTADSGGTTSEGTSSQLLREDGVDGSVAVSYTTAAGAPVSSTTVSNACAGTVYRTGVLAGS